MPAYVAVIRTVLGRAEDEYQATILRTEAAMTKMPTANILRAARNGNTIHLEDGPPSPPV